MCFVALRIWIYFEKFGRMFRNVHYYLDDGALNVNDEKFSRGAPDTSGSSSGQVRETHLVKGE